MRPVLPFLIAAALAACGRSEAVADGAENAASIEGNAARTTASPTGGPQAGNETAASAVDSTTPIPAALHGRWGLSPGDCTSTRGDAKGLLVITGDRLRFYESVAVPAETVLTSDDTVGGNFNFTGEGQNWTKYQNLQIDDGLLVRTERDPIASFRYVRCD
jgi:hypothetical protein